MQSELQKCRHCKLELPYASFHTDKRTSNRIRSICKPCRYNYTKLIYLSDEEYKELLATQNNQCAICCRDATEFKQALNVDHDNITKKIRGLLCTNCNMGLGHFKDTISNLHRALLYIAKHND